MLSYTLVAGRFPFDDKQLRQILLNISKGRNFGLEHLPISRQAQSFILSCLTVDREARPSIIDLLKHNFINNGMRIE